MNTEVTIKSTDVLETIKLIDEYLKQGGIGFDHDALERVAEALNEADHIVITPDTEG